MTTLCCCITSMRSDSDLEDMYIERSEVVSGSPSHWDIMPRVETGVQSGSTGVPNGARNGFWARRRIRALMGTGADAKCASTTIEGSHQGRLHDGWRGALG
ncbi:hypothetical protein MLD38_018331 [Melastoma candidum]|uniref:Uncharacterized protein n=1 Tax=Melastoma candidum TaxID=119954 RepID=A0ACB9QTI4_9MYRT|nr:hypothetical protein MLD38_018331 [Melastoma candidum]